MKKISLLVTVILLAMIVLPGTTFAKSNNTTEKEPHVSYKVHVQNDGWLKDVADGNVAGTTGKSKRMEAVKIKVVGNKNLGIKYRTHIQGKGWTKWCKDGEISGTTGQSKRIEAIQIKLTGKDADKYNVFYCLHIQNVGWLQWVTNEEITGSEGQSLRAEAIMIKIAKKGEKAPKDLNDTYVSYISPNGWLYRGSLR